MTSGACRVQANIWVDVRRHQVSMVAGGQVILVVKMMHEGSPISIPVHGVAAKYFLHRMLKGQFEYSIAVMARSATSSGRGCGPPFTQLATRLGSMY